MNEESKELTIVDDKKSVEPFNNDFDVTDMLATVGKLESTQEQKDIIFAPIEETEILIRPDGKVYLDWTWYSGRLTQAFPLRWTLIPQGMPKNKGNLIVWGFWLTVDGCLMGFAIGEQVATSNQMSYTEACEAAKSNALMRLCKGIGMGTKLWNKPFVEKWINQYAEQSLNESGKQRWKKKAEYAKNDPAVIDAEVIEVNTDAVVKKDQVDHTKTQTTQYRKLTNWAGKEVPADEPLGKAAATAKFETLFVSKFNHANHFMAHIKKHFGVDRASDLTWDMAIALHDHLYDNKDDARFYQPEPTDKKLVSGWDAMKAIRQSFVDKGLEPLYNELTTYVDTRLGSLDGTLVKKTMSNILEAVGIAFDNPPNPTDLQEIKDAIDKDFGKRE